MPNSTPVVKNAITKFSIAVIGPYVGSKPTESGPKTTAIITKFARTRAAITLVIAFKFFISSLNVSLYIPFLHFPYWKIYIVFPDVTVSG